MNPHRPADRLGSAGAIAVLVAALAVFVCRPVAYAEPANDSAPNLTELSAQAQQLTDSMRVAQQDFDTKMRLLGEADRRHDADLAALNAAKAQLAGYQGAVDRFVAAVYRGGRTEGLNALLTAASPKVLIDKLAMQRMVADEISGQLKNFRSSSQEAQTIEAASAESAAAAKAAVDEAVAARAELQRQQSELRTQIRTVQARYAILAPSERAAMAVPPPVAEALGLTAPVPTVGMGGLVPNAKMLAAYIISTYPGVQSIGGVRADPLPDHPSGRAIDIMIGSDMALGDAINADVQNQAARFGVSYTMWRVANHFNHVHVTVN